MYEAIVFLPLLGAVIAGAIALIGARNRLPGEDPPPPDDHAAPHGVPNGDAAHAAHTATPLGAAAAELYGSFAREGHAGEDFSAIIRFLRGG